MKFVEMIKVNTRLISIILLSALFFTNGQIVHSENGQPNENSLTSIIDIDKNVVDILYYDNMEGDKPIVGSMSEEVKYAQHDTDHGRSIELDITKGQKLTFDFVKAGQNSKMDLISFEFLTEKPVIKTTSASDMLLSSAILNYGDEWAGMWRFRRDGNLAYASDFEHWNSTARVTIPENEWVRYDIAIDYESKVVYYYSNGVLFDKNDLKDGIKNFKSLTYQIHYPAVEDCKQYIDNIQVAQVLSYGSELKLPIDVSHPSYVDEFFTIDTKRLGNIYFGDDLDFELDFVNNLTTSKSYSIEAYVMTEKGVKSEPQLTDITIEPNEMKSQTIQFKSDSYGYSTLFVKATDKESGRILELKKDFTVVNPPPEGVKNQKQGIVMGIGHALQEDAAERIGLYAKAGFSAVRASTRWEEYEKTSGEYVMPQRSKEFYEYIRDNGMELMITLAYSNPKISEYFPTTDDSVKAFTDYAYNFVKELKELGIEEPIVEIWNEFNIASFNKENKPVSDFVNLVKASYPQIKKANPQAMVSGFGGATGWNTGSEHIGKTFVEECLKLGVDKYSDCFTIHPYAPSKPAQEAHEAAMRAVTILDEYGVSDKPLYASECGTSAYIINEWQQMIYTVQTAVLSHNNLNRFYWFNDISMQSMQGNEPNYSENGYGWLRGWSEMFTAPYEPYSPKPVFIAMTNYNRLAAGAEQMERIETKDPSLYIYKFKHRDGGNCLVMWVSDKEAERNIEITFDCNFVTFCDVYGNEAVESINNDILTCKISEEPSYIIGDFEDAEIISEYGVSIEQNGDDITLKGNWARPNQEVTLQVLKPDTDVSDINNLTIFDIFDIQKCEFF